ncbi:hypothetical protein B0H14DRAFT_3051086 [Mycena olivaceomarginata]|nr:hypothetical protein B0H14DRAFT_3051086 [Mycena olivaceomarginata]
MFGTALHLFRPHNISQILLALLGTVAAIRPKRRQAQAGGGSVSFRYFFRLFLSVNLQDPLSISRFKTSPY